MNGPTRPTGSIDIDLGDLEAPKGRSWTCTVTVEELRVKCGLFLGHGGVVTTLGPMLAGKISQGQNVTAALLQQTRSGYTFQVFVMPLQNETNTTFAARISAVEQYFSDRKITLQPAT